MMNKNEKGISAKDAPNNLENELLMHNNTPIKNKFQLDLFVTEPPAKVLEIIHCCDCHHTRPLDGYRFGLMPLCADCRTERSLEILSNQVERRAKR
jgi:hypothetical protein